MPSLIFIGSHYSFNYFTFSKKELVLCISTSKRMLAHVFKWSKTIKNAWKILKTFFFLQVHKRFMLGSHLNINKNQSHRNQKRRDLNPSPPGRKPQLCHLSHRISVFDHANACASISLVEIHNKLDMFWRTQEICFIAFTFKLWP